MRSHLKECPRAKQRLGSSHERLDQHLDHRMQVLEQDVSALRSVLNEEIRQRLHLITDVGNLRKQNQIQDEWSHSTDESLKGINRRMEEENTQRTFEVEQCQNDFRYCFDVTQALKNEIQNEMDSLQKHINQLSTEVAEHQNLLNDNILKLEETVLEHEKINRDKFIEVEEFLNGVSEDLKTKFVTNSDLNAKQITMDYEIKSMKNIVCETEERCEKLEGIVTDIDKKLHHTIQALTDLENHLATQQRLTSIQNTRGHLIWRIKDYSKKLEEAKQYDTILHSAMFSNKPYGYALRLDIHLNGKGTWKGRNMIACLNVIAGEFDPLLTWPCRLQADVVIRDQKYNQAEQQDYVKTIQVRKKNDEYFLTNQYFHIPHKVIASRNYLRNDCLFVEVRVLK
ncbi:TNF receptor-associated factor 3-like isoform X2 [Teleopsis dalmanni]|nr:TNF receptor-associated factor 3-like isoform X2 [Teleopsis dalmanni]